ncbi:MULTISPECIES: autotransporter-associated beta strand repeat-containing protein [Dyella]|uniref:Autotransporter domain-containing protein n=2 Tax=Dyella TaxID=231454 RepID=A0A4R0YUC9_9GAMM|nr:MULTISPECIES: autotransporter-associated beta strand repeat-containing protein [Dyella]TBR39390.1 hypothetical protein EYV96_03965 [Dyella terrae]TCI13023.1 hypothetical protein EZM97_06900 [Dyella soli]
MNRVFRVIWSCSLGQFVVASELARSKVKGSRSTSESNKVLGKWGLMAAGVCLALGMAPAAMAHTTSIGYANSGNNSLSFYYGTYHSIADTYFNEGQLHLVNSTGTFDQTVQFSILTSDKPAGLVDGDTNFYSGAVNYLSGNEADIGQGRVILNWQGVTFTGLTAGTYTFTYVPIQNPTQVWEPINNAILSNTVTIITADLSTAHRIGEGEVVDQTYDTDPMIMDGGKERSTADGTLEQIVSITGKNGTFDTNDHDLTISGDIDGRGDLIKEGEGTLYIRGNNTNTGDTVVKGGAVNVERDSQLGDTHADVVLDGGTLQWGNQFDLDANRDIIIGNNGGTLDTNGYDTTVSQGISGTGDLTKTGEGSLTLDGHNTYTGGTHVDGGDLVVGSNSNLGNGRLTVGDDATATLNNGAQTVAGIDGNGDIVLNGTTLTTNGTNDANFSGDISGTGGLVKNGDYTQVLSGNNSYTGGTTLNQGTLEISADNNLGHAGDTLVLNGGSLHTAGDVDSTRDLTVNGGSINVDANTAFQTSGDVTGTGGLIKNGEGSMSLTGDLSQSGGTTINNGTLVLSGDNTYTGGTTVNGGTLEVSSDTNLGHAGDTLVLNGGSLHTTGDVDSTRDLTVNGGSINVDANTSFQTSGDVTGTGGLVKNGEGSMSLTGDLSQSGGTTVNNGTLVLSGDNTYTGGTTVNGGTLEVSSDTNLGHAGDTLTLNGGSLHTTGDINSSRDLTVNGGSLDIDGNTHVVTSGDVSGTGGLVKNGEGSLSISGDLSQSGGTTVNDGLLVLSGNNTYTGGTTINGGTIEVSADENLGHDGDTLVLNGGSLHATGNIDSTRDLELNGGTLDIDGGRTFQSSGDATGTGGLVKNGEGILWLSGNLSQSGGTTLNDGALVLSGNNTYTGGTTINGGVLAISSDANLGHAGDALTLNGGVLVATGDVNSARDMALNGGALYVDGNSTFSNTGNVTGTGGLVKDGTGTLSLGGSLSHSGGTTVNDGNLVLSGNNSYTGGTQLNGGTLTISSDANLGNANGGLTFNGGSLHTTGNVDTSRNIILDKTANIVTDAGTSLVSHGDVSGTGGLVKNGAGTLDIAGTASHSGGTTVNDGTLVLSGNNTYTGGTTINGGTLSISSDANLGDASGDVLLNGGTLQVTDTMTTQRDMVIGTNGGAIDTGTGATLYQQGSISGNGTLVKQGGGTLVVSGSNTFTGGTLVDGGAIRIDTGSSLGTGDIILRGGILETYATLGTGQRVIVSGDSGVNVSAGTTTVLSGDINTDGQSGCFVKSGAGSLSLTGNSNLAQGTCVQNGTLRANGNLDSSFVTVDAIAALRGTGTIRGPVSVSGRLAPGNSPGTLVVEGPVTMNAGSVFEADIDGLGTGTGAGNYSRLLVVGAGNPFFANGTLEPLLRGITGDASNTYTPSLGDTYRIVTAEGGIVGRFSSVTQPTAGMTPGARFVAFYDVGNSHSIDLRVIPNAYGDLLGKGATKNALAAAGALDQAMNAQVAGTGNNYSATMYGLSSMKSGDIAGVVKAMAGDVFADQAASARSGGLAMHRDAVDHLSTDHVDTGTLAWANFTQDGLRSTADAQGTGFNTSTSRLTAGLDLYSSESTTIGVAASHGDSNVIATGGRGNIRGNAGMIYAQQKAGSVLIDGMLARGSERWTSHRNDPLGQGELESRADGHSTTASLTVRLPMDAGSSRIEPYVGVVWQKIERDAFSETGSSPLALSLDSLSQTGTRGVVGLNATSRSIDPLAVDSTWRVGVAAGMDSSGLLSPTVRARVVGQSFDTRAPDAGRGFVQVNASGTMRLRKQAYLYGGLTAEQGSGRAAYGVTAGVRVSF